MCERERWVFFLERKKVFLFSEIGGGENKEKQSKMRERESVSVCVCVSCVFFFLEEESVFVF